ncbi:hypothetical protein BDV93DRAFT_505434 [Ceratobasidium sp. AG-I]|nr:hypothetical protein BDV93DRAFT_505434 [Ceratobasidium sp. AG-I]
MTPTNGASTFISAFALGGPTFGCEQTNSQSCLETKSLSENEGSAEKLVTQGLARTQKVQYMCCLSAEGPVESLDAAQSGERAGQSGSTLDVIDRRADNRDQGPGSFSETEVLRRRRLNGIYKSSGVAQTVSASIGGPRTARQGRIIVDENKDGWRGVDTSRGVNVCALRS